MQTNISEHYAQTQQAQEADEILRACVHCGFCNATCPTYQLLGDELDAPRGRIYLIKQLLEGKEVSAKTQQHLDRCLSCRSCETTCPSGVQYGRLVDIGRELIEQEVPRPKWVALQRRMLRKILPYPKRIKPMLILGQTLRPMLPNALKAKVPPRQKIKPRVEHKHERKMLILEGCVQSVATPQTNAAARRLLDRLGIELVSATGAGCCGAVSHHLAASEEGLDFMRRNIDAWWPYVEQGIDAIVITASGCGVMLKEYGELLKHDGDYADRARVISELARDIGEVLRAEDLSALDIDAGERSIAFHSPCTLQHGMKLNGLVEEILDKLGFDRVDVENAHLCCGSAGTYSILQPELSQQLLDNKLAALEKDQPALIVTANIGCQLHLASKAQAPVKHWIELLSDSLSEQSVASGNATTA